MAHLFDDDAPVISNNSAGLNQPPASNIPETTNIGGPELISPPIQS